VKHLINCTGRIAPRALRFDALAPHFADPAEGASAAFARLEYEATRKIA